MTLYFLHIPKSAGTSVTRVLDNYFNKSSILPYQTWNQLLPNLPIEFSNFELIRGHFGYGLYKILNKKPVYLTMLRNPIERTISQYHHIRMDPHTNNWVDEDFLKPSDALSDLLNDKEKRKLFVNTQCRYLALDIDVNSIVGEHKERFLYDTCNEFISPDITNVDLLNSAKDRLSNFEFFGLQERFEESLMLLYYTFSLKPIAPLPRDMMWRGRPRQKDLSDSVINLIKNCTSLDSHLYEFAVKIFELRFNIMVNDLKENYYKASFDKLPFKEVIYEMLSEHCTKYPTLKEPTPKKKNLLKTRLKIIRNVSFR